MNAERRKKITKLEDALVAIHSDVECLRDEEEEAYSNLPESLQQSDCGLRMEEVLAQLEEAIDYLDSAMQSLSNAAGTN